MILHKEKKYNKVINKIINIISKLISNQYQLIIKNKIPKKAQITLYKRFQYINLMSISQIIYDITTKKFSNFKNVHKYISHYQVFFDKIISFFIKISFYIYNNIERYFQATILMNIRLEYLAPVSAIQKNQKDENIN